MRGALPYKYRYEYSPGPRAHDAPVREFRRSPTWKNSMVGSVARELSATGSTRPGASFPLTLHCEAINPTNQKAVFSLKNFVQTKIRAGDSVATAWRHGFDGACARFTPRTFGMIAAHINAESPLDRETTTSTTISPIVGGSSRWGSRTKAAESTCGLRSGPREHGRAARNFGGVRWRVETTSTRGQVTRAGSGACAVLCAEFFRDLHQSAPRRPTRGTRRGHNDHYS